MGSLYHPARWRPTLFPPALFLLVTASQDSHKLLPGGDVLSLRSTTNGSGRASFDPTTPEPGQGNLCVTSIAVEGYDYNPGDNNLTCLDIVFQ
jgi:hypothetical protein